MSPVYHISYVTTKVHKRVRVRHANPGLRVHRRTGSGDRVDTQSIMKLHALFDPRAHGRHVEQPCRAMLLYGCLVGRGVRWIARDVMLRCPRKRRSVSTAVWPCTALALNLRRHRNQDIRRLNHSHSHARNHCMKHRRLLHPSRRPSIRPPIPSRPTRSRPIPSRRTHSRSATRRHPTRRHIMRHRLNPSSRIPPFRTRLRPQRIRHLRVG